METKVVRITINVAGKEIDFTPDEAKELKRVLQNIYPDPVSIPYVIERDHWWTRPAEPWRPFGPWWGKTTMGNTGAAICLSNDRDC